jgi:VanZ family protein
MGGGMNPALTPFPPHIRRAASIVSLALAVTIAYFSLVAPGDAPAPHISDKIRHFAAYLTLAIPVTIWIGPGRFIAVIVTTLIGVGLEIAQAIVPTGREASIGDALANGLGAAAGVALVWIIARTRRA